MTNLLNASQTFSKFSWRTFLSRLLQASLMLLAFGLVFIILFHFNIAVDVMTPSAANPIAFAGGAIVLVALTFFGVPVGAATVAGAAIWLAIQNFL